MLISGESDSSVATVQLFIPAVCSRVFADDLSGITLLTAAIAATPPGPRTQSSNFRSTVFPVHACLAAYANRHDAKIPAASGEIILAYAKALAGRKNENYLGMASRLVHYAATDAASLDAGLKSCGLEGVKPFTAYSPNNGGRVDPKLVQAMMRVALLHPAGSAALLESLDTPHFSDPTTSDILPLLLEPGLRAKISPALFLTWNRHLQISTPEDLEVLNLYATERRGDFDETQQTELDALLQSLQPRANLGDPGDPAPLRGFRRQLQEESLRWNQQQNLKPKTQPR